MKASPFILSAGGLITLATLYELHTEVFPERPHAQQEKVFLPDTSTSSSSTSTSALSTLAKDLSCTAYAKRIVASPALACNPSYRSHYWGDIVEVEQRCAVELEAVKHNVSCHQGMIATSYNRARNGGKGSYRTYWRGLHAGLKKEGKGVASRVVFVGDSLTAALREGEPFPATRRHFLKVFDPTGNNHPLALGIPGDETQSLLFRLLDGELEETNPELIILLIGTNNLNWGKGDQRDVGSVSDSVNAIVGLLKMLKPTAKLLVQGVLPRGGQCRVPKRGRYVNCKLPYSAVVPAINAKVESFVATQPGAWFVDCGHALDLNETSEHYFSDHTHILPKGYASMWTKCLLPQISKIGVKFDTKDATFVPDS